MNRARDTLRMAADVLLRPRRAFDALSAQPRLGLPLIAALLLGGSWSALSAALAAQGLTPTMDRGLPMPAADYYRLAAFYLVPLCLTLTGLTAAVAHGLARALGGDGSAAGSLSAVGAAYALPLLVVYLIPDALIFALAGHGAMGVAVRFTLPAAALLVTVRTVQALKAVHGLGTGRALLAALGAALAQGLPFAWLVR